KQDDGSDLFRRGIDALERLRTIDPPEQTVLLRNFPNPFNPETWVPFELADAADVTVVFYDARGQVVRSLELGAMAAGDYTTRGRAAYWDGRDNNGEQASSGVYFIEFRAGSYRETRRILLMK
ncbi:MAG TPA: T9SS type A sorting domain-containing protein, partial [Planctomycetes bacterium]|nr:T9SS type A sorting domain-containing protein [Planctomycetota bacterium]